MSGGETPDGGLQVKTKLTTITFQKNKNKIRVLMTTQVMITYY